MGEGCGAASQHLTCGTRPMLAQPFVGAATEPDGAQARCVEQPGCIGRTATTRTTHRYKLEAAVQLRQASAQVVQSNMQRIGYVGTFIFFAAAHIYEAYRPVGLQLLQHVLGLDACGGSRQSLGHAYADDERRDNCEHPDEGNGMPNTEQIGNDAR